MRIISTESELIKLVSENKSELGFVPTMGALHEGHLSLLRRAKLENELVLCSIFVNPTQFDKPNDLEKYPRQQEADLDLLRIVGCDFVFTPTVSEMYPEGLKKLKFDFGILDKVMEAAHRPGHFDGVATIVKRFFELIKPTRAYFGEKDFQQLLVIKEMLLQLAFDIEIVPCETLREPNGLARSSRNERLPAQKRIDAAVIFEALTYAKDHYRTKSPLECLTEMRSLIESIDDGEIEYLKIVNEDSLLDIENWEDAVHARACVAVNIGDVRLIDNLLIF